MGWIKVSDEGTSSPFIARIFMGMLVLRDQLYLMNIDSDSQNNARDKFDKQFNPMFEAAQATRDAGKNLIGNFNDYFSSIKSGDSVKIENGQIQVIRTIDTELIQDVNKTIDQSVIAIKSALQKILKKMFAIDIGFLFQKEDIFNDGIKTLRDKSEEPLAEYLIAVRSNWLWELLTLRNAIEHEGWVLDRIEYYFGQNRIAVKIPEINGVPVNIYVSQTVNRVLLFIENMMVFGMQQFPRYPLFVTEIPKEQRNPKSPERFRLSTFGLEEVIPWSIRYSEESDFLQY